jgi:hypothetical protein
MVNWIFLVEIILILIFATVFYKSGFRDRFERPFWIVIFVVVGISLFELRACDAVPGSGNICRAKTILFSTVFVVLNIIAISLFLVHRIEKKWAEPRIRKKGEELLRKREAAKKKAEEKGKQK